MALDYRDVKVTLGDAIVLYDFLSDAQEAEQGIHSDDPVINLAFWHVLGAIEREVVPEIDSPEEYERVRLAALKELREAAIGD